MPTYEEYIEAIKPLWDSCWITNMGHYHQQLEEQLVEYLNVDNVSLMVNGHMALELTIQAFNFPEGSEIITTPFTFISTTHAIIRNRLQPVFCDVKRSDGTIDESKIEELITERTVAILPVHVYGNVCNVEAIQEIARKNNLKVIYDAAHAFGVRYKNRGIGSFGDASTFSFHATKVFNTIEGGAVTHNNPTLGDKLYNLKNFGIMGEELVVDVGANAKMNEFCAIMGLCNLKNIDEVIEKRKTLSDYYYSEIREIEGIHTWDINHDQTRNYAYFPVLISDEYGLDRNEVYELLKQKSIFSRKYFWPLTSDQNCFSGLYQYCDLDVARDLAKRVISLPLYEDLEFETIDRIISILRNKK